MIAPPRLRVATIGLIVIIAAPCAPPQAPGESRGPVFRATTSLVQVDASVTDSKGQPVAGLVARDFQILEDGKPQKITHFSYIRAAAPGLPPVTGSTQLPPRAALPSKPLERQQVQRTMVLIVDDLGLSADGIAGVRTALKGFVEHQMQTGDLVSIMTTSGGMGINEQPTTDRRQIQAAVDRIHWSPGRNGLSWYDTIRRGDKPLEFEYARDQRLNPIRRAFLGTATMAAVMYAIQGLRDMPGRKAMVLFSDGLNGSAGGMIDMANRASVVLYTFDPRGLVSFGMRAEDVCLACTGQFLNVLENDFNSNRQSDFNRSQTGLEVAARETGGLFFHDNNDLGRGLSEVVDDMGSYYLIGYQPRREDAEGTEPRFHRLEVRVTRPGLQVRSRKGFLAGPDPGNTEVTAPTGREALKRALFSAFRADGFPVRLSAFYAPSADKDPSTGRRSTRLQARLAIDAREFSPRNAPGGKQQLVIQVMALATGPDGQPAAGDDQTFKPEMSADEMRQTLASGLLYGFDLPIEHPGPHQLRVAVQDVQSGRIGSAAMFVEVPDFNRPGLTLSSLLLHDADTGGNESPPHGGIPAAGSEISRVFARGSVLHYDCTVVGLPAAKAAPRTLDIQVTLFRGPVQLFQGAPESVPVPVPEAELGKPIHASGKIHISPALPPGEYALALTVYNPQDGAKGRGAVQWADFTLVE